MAPGATIAGGLTAFISLWTSDANFSAERDAKQYLQIGVALGSMVYNAWSRLTGNTVQSQLAPTIRKFRKRNSLRSNVKLAKSPAYRDSNGRHGVW